MRILLSNPYSYKSIVVASFIKKNFASVECIGFSTERKFINIYSKYFDRILFLSKNNYKEELVDFCNKESVNHIFLINSSANHIFLKYKKDLEPLLDHHSDYELFSYLNNKSNLQEITEGTSLVNPKIYEIGDNIDYPIVVKPSVSTSAKNIKYITNEEGLQTLQKKLDLNNFTIQQYINGEGVGYSFFSVDGEVYNSYSHRRLMEFPIKGGSSTYRIRHENDHIREGCIEIIKKYNWSGFIMFEFKKSNDDYFLIEINPRVWGGIGQGLQEGENFFSYFLGEIKNRQYKTTYNSPLVYLSMLLHLFKFNIKPLLIFFTNLRSNRSDISLFRDFFGWITSIFYKS